MVMPHCGFTFVMPEDTENYEELVFQDEPECVYCGSYISDCYC